LDPIGDHPGIKRVLGEIKIAKVVSQKEGRPRESLRKFSVCGVID
jgi:hypothetical protein